MPNYETLSKSKTWGANYKIDETCGKRQLFCIELQKICRGGYTVKVWCNSLVLPYYGTERGNPLMGGYTQVVWGAYFNICRWRGGGCPVHGGNQLNWVT